MNIFETILFTVILISYPLLVYTFYLAYNKNIGKEENQLFLDFSLITSFYFVIKFSNNNYSSLILLNVILLIAYYKKRILSVFLISLFLILYYSSIKFLPLHFLILQYLLTCIFYFCFKRKFLTFIFCFVVLEIIFLIFYQTTDAFLLFLEALSLLFTTLFLILLLEKADEILKYHMTVKELEQEKQIRISLFKITHEIKNPIAVCKGYLDMFDINNQTHSKKYIPIIKEEINRVLLLLEDFLSMKQLSLNLEVLDINFLLEDVLKRYELLLKKNHISLQFNVLEDEIYLEGDYQRLIQLFINIIKNSIEAMEESKNKKITISEVINDNFITITLEDTGCGMNDESLNKIGEPFFTTKMRGTGLGVSLSKEIIKAHHGEISYETKEKVGTKVILTLPLYHLD